MPSIASIVNDIGLPNAKGEMSKEMGAKSLRGKRSKGKKQQGQGVYFREKEAEQLSQDEDTTANGSCSSDNDASISSLSVVECSRATLQAAPKPTLARLREMGNDVLSQMHSHCGKVKKGAKSNVPQAAREVKAQFGAVQHKALTSATYAAVDVGPVKISPSDALAGWIAKSDFLKSGMDKKPDVMKRPIFHEALWFPCDTRGDCPLKVPMSDSLVLDGPFASGMPGAWAY
jgi:hypothetical protein